MGLPVGLKYHGGFRGRLDPRRLAALILNILIILSSVLALFYMSTVLLTAAALRVEPGSPRWGLEGDRVILSLPLRFTNPGPRALEVNGLEAQVAFSGFELGRGSTGPVIIGAGEDRVIMHNVAIPLHGLPEEVVGRLLFQDQELDVRLSARLGFPPLAQAQVSASLKFPWGAPLRDLRVDPPRVQASNATHIALAFGLGFTNGSPYVDVDSIITIRVLNQTTGVQLGSGVLRVHAPRQTAFEGVATIYLELSKLPLERLVFEDRVLRLQWVMEGSVSGIGLRVAREVQVDWRAPIYNLQVGGPRLLASNATHVALAVKVGFINRSPYLSVDSPLTIRLVNETSGAQLGLGVLKVSAPPQTAFEGDAIIQLELSKLPLERLMFEDRELRLRALLQGGVMGFSFTVARDLRVDWRAPMGRLEVGRVMVTPISPTQARLSIPVAFNNASPILTIAGQLVVEVINMAGVSLGSSPPITLDVPPGAGFQGILELVVDPQGLSSTMTIRLLFQLAQGSFTWTTVVSLG